ncbi:MULTISPECIES: NAD kinase [Bacillaceae]|uniref:NAD kinase n=1 Tax=Domibacillus aminovorans TaxID=29332 RepID=A0A177L636_9BACI|nr:MULTISPECIES: NAD kinase [Bacillaceae]OAH52897.1 NAD(+) kinase [Domibacillus aminovorans]OAH60826.1 NAD(+) kinase [Domibacillus aminovorans]
METRRNIFFSYKKDPAKLPDIEQLMTIAKEQGFEIVTNQDAANIIVAVGGDGAFLQAVRKSGFRDDCLYVGVTDEEEASLYCDFHIYDTESMIAAMQTANVEVRRYPVIDVHLDGHTHFHCLNELSVRSSIIKTFVIDVIIDDLHFETFRGDGIVVSTPTGSTAYNRSLNGAVVDPLIPCIQVSEMASLNNNQFRTLGSSFILSDSRKLTLHIVQDGNEYPVIGLDNEALSVQNTKNIEVEMSGKIIKTVKLKNNSFWHKVQRTFL